MTQKIILQLEIDDSQLDRAQAKLDKLRETLKDISEEITRLKKTYDIDLGEILKEVK